MKDWRQMEGIETCFLLFFGETILPKTKPRSNPKERYRQNKKRQQKKYEYPFGFSFSVKPFCRKTKTNEKTTSLVSAFYPANDVHKVKCVKGAFDGRFLPNGVCSMAVLIFSLVLFLIQKILNRKNKTSWETTKLRRERGSEKKTLFF